jgi:ELWxxDGT repeat protein
VDDAAALGDTLVLRSGALLFAATETTLTQIHDFETALVGALAPAGGSRVAFLVDGKWWATDGSVSGTRALAAVDAGVQDNGGLLAVAGKLFYFVENAGVLTLWRATPGEGQAYGAEPLAIAALAALTPDSWKLLGAIDGLALFTVTVGSVTSLWASNGFGDPLLGGQTPGTIVIVANLGGEADYVTVRDGGLYFTVTEAAGVISLWRSEGTAAFTQKVVLELPGNVNSRAILNGETYFIAGPTNTPLLWKLTDTGVKLIAFLPRNAANLTAAYDQLVFTARVEGVYGIGPSLWVSDGTEAGTRMVVDLTPIAPGFITSIAGTANGIVFIVRNDAALVEGFTDYSLWISNGFRDGTYPLISSNGGGWAFGSPTNRPTLLRVVGSVAFYEYQGDVYATDGTVAGTRLLAEGLKPATHLESDGRFVMLDGDDHLWISEGNLVGLSYRIEVKAPLQGNNHASSDRDLLIGGEGEDILIGNADHDQIFGGSGDDFFVAENSEIRDRAANENYALPPTAQFSVQQPRQPDAEVDIPDIALRAAIARALGIPVTTGFDGRPVIHGVILASQIATLVELQADNLGIQSVVSLHFARNLRVLNLNGNRISDLSILVPATDPVTGARTGLSNLRAFSIDYNGMGILTFGGDEYVDVDADINEIQMTVTFWFRTNATGQAQGLFSMDNGVRGAGGLDRSLWIDANGNIAAFMYGGASAGYEVIRSSGTNYADGNWHHVAYLFSADGAGVAQRIYVNGVQVALGTLTSSSLSVQDGVNFGFAHAAPGSAASGSFIPGGVPNIPGSAVFFSGDMDEVRIWDTAFTDLQVNADMIQPYPAERVYLVGYWSFDGAANTVAIDHSLFGRNGSFGGGNIDLAPAYNRMQPTLANRPTPNQALLPVGAERTLFETVLRDLGRLNVPGPLDKFSAAYTRVDVLDPLSTLPDLSFVNLTGIVTPAASSLGVIIDHVADDVSKLFETKDGTRIVVEGDRTLVLSAGTWAWRRLTVGGGVDNDESFTLEIDGTDLHISAFGVTETVALADFDQIVFEGGNGNDVLGILGDLAKTLYAIGGDGNDHLEGGVADTYLFGGLGNDTLVIRGGNTVAAGGDNDDTYVFRNAWGDTIVNELAGRGTDIFDFSAVTTDLVLNVRGTSTTLNGSVRHLANSIERFIGGTGNDTLNFHRDNGGVLELRNGAFTWDGVAITHTGIEAIDVRFVNSLTGLRSGVVRVLEDQDYTGLDLRLEARSIDLRASVTADGLSFISTTLIALTQNFSGLEGLGRVNTLTADRIRFEATNGVGDVNVPLYLRAGVIEAATQGAAGIYLVQINDAVIGDVDFGDSTEGLSTGAGGNIHLVNLGGTLSVASDIQASGGTLILSSEKMDIQANLSSTRTVGGQLFRGTLLLQTLSIYSSIGMATAGTETLHFSADEINRFMSGFDQRSPAAYLVNGVLTFSPSLSGITIGRADGRNEINLDAFTYTESFTFRSPEPFGSFNILGTIRLEPSLVDGDLPTLSYDGWSN